MRVSCLFPNRTGPRTFWLSACTALMVAALLATFPTSAQAADNCHKFKTEPECMDKKDPETVCGPAKRCFWTSRKECRCPLTPKSPIVEDPSPPPSEGRHGGGTIHVR